MTISHTVTLLNNTHTLGTARALSIEGDNGYSTVVNAYQSVSFDLTKIQTDELFVDTLFALVTSTDLIVSLDGTIFTANQVGQWKYVDASGAVPSPSGPSWYLVGPQNFIIDLEDVTGTTYGFKVIDTAAEYFQVIRKADAKLDLESALQNIALNASVDFSATSGGTADIDATGNMTLDSDAATSIGGASVALEADGGILSLTGDGAADIDIINTGAAIDIDSADLTVDVTNDLTLTVTNDLTLDVTNDLVLDADAATSIGGASVALEADGGILSLTGDGAADIDIINAGAGIDIDSDTLNVDTTGAIAVDSASTISLVAAGGLTMQLSVALDDLTAHGLTIEGTVTPAGTFGQSLYIDGTGAYVLTDADAAATMPCTALVIDTGAGAAKSLLLQGLMRNDTWTWTPGGTLFASTTAGALTQTAPSGLGDQVQPVGHAVSATIIYFNPIRYWHEVV